jgi:hypothetical protein
LVFEVFGEVDGGHATLSQLSLDRIPIRKCRSESFD